ncbi:MAG: hypothetical protein JSW53_00300 [Candidatus Bathyarchaeota archaeon]|nr:MAG: hypothetical protein JSW53_00300 [Candidatus Bathyarchaeota archaeon]
MESRDWLAIVSLGFFLVLVGVIWIITPDLWNEVIDFFKSFHLANVTEHIILPAPAHTHPVVYTAASQFCLTFGIFHIVILALRFVLGESLDRKSGTLSGIVFWLGSGLFLTMLAAGEIRWFDFLAGLVACIGLMIIVSSLVKLLFR